MLICMDMVCINICKEQAKIFNVSTLQKIHPTICYTIIKEATQNFFA